jgi:methionyl-tRNA synthetase
MPIQNPQRYTVTAALIYANGPIHIGHLAGCYLPADIYVRYLRQQGRDVAFISGTDEHGVPITIKARKEGITPQEVVDKYYTQIRDAFQEFGISFDIYSRTSKPAHHQVSQDFFANLYNKGIFREEVTEQYYDQKAAQFLADRYIVGTCPNCGNPNAYGDQCERCGTSLSPEELINPHSTLSGEPPIKRPTKNWYLPLDQLQPKIKAYVDSHPEWKTNVAGQCQSWLNAGLHPRAMTRDLDWGVKVPLPDTEGKVLYVWFDAPIGYITFTKELFESRGQDWEPYWKDPNTKLVHFIGKDNIVFHCIIFPSMLMEHGEFVLADNVPANEFMNLEGDKISTSRNWAVWLHEYLRDFEGKQDVLRYVLCANSPENKDSDFSWKDFQARNNNELADNLGNFVNRALVLTQKYFGGKVPPRSQLFDIDLSIIENIRRMPGQIAAAIEAFRFREALTLLMELSRMGNKYLADTEPWKLIKTDESRVQTIMNLSLQLVANLAIAMEPFLPFTAGRLNSMLNLPGYRWKDAGGIDLLAEGHRLGESSLLFTKIEDPIIEAQVQKLLDAKKGNEQAAQATAAAEAPPAKPLAEPKPAVSFDDFTKMDIRVATILAAEAVPKTKKLLKLTLDTGIERRTVVSGIAEHYQPGEIIGKQVCLLANLAPRQIMGIMSQGMILMAEDANGSLAFLRPEKLVTNGGTVR